MSESHSGEPCMDAWISLGTQISIATLAQWSVEANLPAWQAGYINWG